MMSQATTRTREDSLLSQSFDITVLGVILTAVMSLVDKTINGQGILIICCFLASVYIWKLIWPIDWLRRYMVGQLFCMAMVAVFSWWLMYTAENTRAGWYRFNVLQQRVQSFVKNAPAYVVMTDESGNVTATSDNIESLTGYTPKELIGRPASILMRSEKVDKHTESFDRSVALLKNPYSENQGWMLQGLITVGIKHKNGNVVPVKAYAGGIRWSTDVSFPGDIDMFAVFVPVESSNATKGFSTITTEDKPGLQTAPAPPQFTLPPKK